MKKQIEEIVERYLAGESLKEIINEIKIRNTKIRHNRDTVEHYVDLMFKGWGD